MEAINSCTIFGKGELTLLYPTAAEKVTGYGGFGDSVML